mmetsp:Transcript_16340/g.39379  ORF Transcript_16340/g.39379 Transcript_16340/m.39379 type:complete len:200 (-) Transcript_16340:1259-1858(-)
MSSIRSPSSSSFCFTTSWASLEVAPTLKTPLSMARSPMRRRAFALLSIRSSTVEGVTSLMTSVCFFWPMRLMRALACSSIMGFQSESKIITVSAVWRLTPCPPARVLRRKRKISEFGLLKSSISFALSSEAVAPTSLRKLKPLERMYSSSMSSSFVIWLYISTLCPHALSFGRIRSSTSSFPHTRTRLWGPRSYSLASR